MDDLDRLLAAHSLVGLDTSVWIYHLEANERYLPLTRQIPNAVRLGEPKAVVSGITVMELNVQPHRIGQPGLAAHDEAILTHFPHASSTSIGPSLDERRNYGPATGCGRPTPGTWLPAWWPGPQPGSPITARSGGWRRTSRYWCWMIFLKQSANCSNPPVPL